MSFHIHPIFDLFPGKKKITCEKLLFYQFLFLTRFICVKQYFLIKIFWFSQNTALLLLQHGGWVLSVFHNFFDKFACNKFHRNQNKNKSKKTFMWLRTIKSSITLNGKNNKHYFYLKLEIKSGIKGSNHFLCRVWEWTPFLYERDF